MERQGAAEIKEMEWMFFGNKAAGQRRLRPVSFESDDADTSVRFLIGSQQNSKNITARPFLCGYSFPIVSWLLLAMDNVPGTALIGRRICFITTSINKSMFSDALTAVYFQ